MKNKLFILATLGILGCSHLAVVQPDPTHNLQKQLNIVPPAPASIEWYHNFDSAAGAAVSTHKPMMMFFHSRYCGWCKKMQLETFADTAIINKVSSNFIPLSVDMRDDLAKDLAIEATPTIVIVSISEQGKVTNLGSVVGFIEHEELLKVFNECLAQVPN